MQHHSVKAVSQVSLAVSICPFACRTFCSLQARCCGLRTCHRAFAFLLDRIIEKKEDNTRKQKYKLFLVHGAGKLRSEVLEQVRLSRASQDPSSFHGAIFA